MPRKSVIVSRRREACEEAQGERETNAGEKQK